LTRASFGRDWDEVLTEWARGGPMNVTAEDGWAALGALERLRPEYLAEVHETQIRANFTLSHLIAHGMDLLACEGLPGLSRIIDRIEKGDLGGASEIRAAAFFRRLGLSLTLEPVLDGKKPDLAVEGEGRSYLEVIGPGWPAALKELVGLLDEAADALVSVVKVGQHLQVAFLRDPTPSVIGVVATALPSLPEAQDIRQVEDLALVRLTPFGEETQGIELSERPVYGVARFEETAGHGYNVNVKAAFTDERGGRLLEGERSHFQEGQPNIVVIDVSQIGGGIRAWTPLIERSFQMEQNTLIGAAVLCGLHFNRVVTPGVLEGCVVENPNAAAPISRDLLAKIVAGLEVPSLGNDEPSPTTG
jgi:hypothetical protein